MSKMQYQGQVNHFNEFLKELEKDRPMENEMSKHPTYTKFSDESLRETIHEFSLIRRRILDNVRPVLSLDYCEHVLEFLKELACHRQRDLEPSIDLTRIRTAAILQSGMLSNPSTSIRDDDLTGLSLLQADRLINQVARDRIG